MIKLCARYGCPTFSEWKRIWDIVWLHINDTAEWKNGGFEGLNSITTDLFRFKVMRNIEDDVEFIFDEDQDYVYFKLRWF